jgi:hypothetical protein
MANVIVNHDRANAALMEAQAASIAKHFVARVPLSAAAVHATQMLLNMYEFKAKGPVEVHPRHIAVMIDLAIRIPKLEAALREMIVAFRSAYEGGFADVRIFDWDSEGHPMQRQWSPDERDAAHEAIKKMDLAINYLPTFSPAGEKTING